MLFLVYNFMLICYGFVHGGPERGKFNETQLTKQLHQSLLEVDAFLESVQNKIHRNKSSLRQQDLPGTESKDYKDLDTREIMNHPDMTTRDLFLDYGVTNVWWNDTPWEAEFTIPSFPLTSMINSSIPYLFSKPDITHGSHYISPHSSYETPRPGMETPHTKTTSKETTLRPEVPITNDDTTPQPTISDITTQPSTAETLEKPTASSLDIPDLTSTQVHPETLVPSPSGDHDYTDKPVTTSVATHENPDTSSPEAKPFEVPDLNSPGAPENTDAPATPPGSEHDNNNLTATTSPEHKPTEPQPEGVPDKPTDNLDMDAENTENVLIPKDTKPPDTHGALSSRIVSQNSSATLHWWKEIKNNTALEAFLKNLTHSNSTAVSFIQRQGTTLNTTVTFPKTAGTPPTALAKQSAYPEEVDGQLILVTIPSTLKGNVTRPGVTTTTPTTAGDVLHGLIIVEEPKEETYLKDLKKMMIDNDIGPLEVFLLRFLYAIGSKNASATESVMFQTEFVINKLSDMNRLWYLGEPLLNYVMEFARMIHAGSYDVFQRFAITRYLMLKDRKQVCAVDTNSIIDFADLLFNEEEAMALFNNLKEFEKDPKNRTQSDYELCESIVEALLAPARRLGGSERRTRLFDSINYALKNRPYILSRRRNNGWFTGMWGGVPSFNVKTTFDPEIQTPRSKRREFHKKIINTKDINYNRHMEIKINERPNFLDKHSDYNYERQLRRNFYMPYNMPTRRTVTTTTVQKRFNVITPAEPRVPTIRTTRAKPTPFIIPETRPTTDYKPVKFDGSYRVPHTTTKMTPLHYFNTVKMDYKRARNVRNLTVNKRSKRKKQKRNTITTQSPITSLYILNKRRSNNQIENKRKRFKIKKDIVHKIRDGSSYSDEEEALKVNLISAMIHGNRSFDTAEVLDDTHWKDTEDMEKGLLRRASHAEVHLEWPHATKRKFLLKNRHGAVHNRI